MVWDINEGEKNAEVVFALEIANASVYVFRMETVVFETEVGYGVSHDICANGLSMMISPQEERTRRQAKDVIRRYVTVFPRYRSDAGQERIAALARRHQDARADSLLLDDLGLWLHDGICRAAGRWFVDDLRRGLLHGAAACWRNRVDSCHCLEQGIIGAIIVIHGLLSWYSSFYGIEMTGSSGCCWDDSRLNVKRSSPHRAQELTVGKSGARH